MVTSVPVVTLSVREAVRQINDEITEELLKSLTSFSLQFHISFWQQRHTLPIIFELAVHDTNCPQVKNLPYDGREKKMFGIYGVIKDYKVSALLMRQPAFWNGMLEETVHTVSREVSKEFECQELIVRYQMHIYHYHEKEQQVHKIQTHYENQILLL